MIIGERFSPYRLFHGAFIPNCIMRYQGLTSSEKLLWARLAQYAGKDGNCHPSYQKLAVELNISRRQVIKIINKLIKKGFITKASRYYLNDDDQPFQTSNIFSFLWHEIFQKENQNSLGSVPDNTSPSEPHDTFVVSRSSPKENHRRESYKENIYMSGSELLDYLNKKRKEILNLKYPFRKIHNHVTARLKEGYTVEDGKKVIDWKIHDWKDKKDMWQYLTLETLFRPTKFDRYLTEAKENEDAMLKGEYKEYVDCQWDKVKKALNKAVTQKEEERIRAQHKPFSFEQWLHAKQNSKG